MEYDYLITWNTRITLFFYSRRKFVQDFNLTFWYILQVRKTNTPIDMGDPYQKLESFSIFGTYKFKNKSKEWKRFSNFELFIYQHVTVYLASFLVFFRNIYPLFCSKCNVIGFPSNWKVKSSELGSMYVPKTDRLARSAPLISTSILSFR